MGDSEPKDYSFSGIFLLWKFSCFASSVIAQLSPCMSVSGYLVYHMYNTVFFRDSLYVFLILYDI